MADTKTPGWLSKVVNEAIVFLETGSKWLEGAAELLPKAISLLQEAAELLPKGIAAINHWIEVLRAFVNVQNPQKPTS